MVNSAIYAFKTIVDNTSMNSPITVEDSDDEVITSVTHDANKDACFNNGQIYESDNSTKRLSANESIIDTKINVDGRNFQSSQPDEINTRPAFKVMFRDESISRQYRQQIKDFLHNLVQSKSYCEVDYKDVNESNLILEVWDNKDNSICQNTSVSVENSVLNSNNIQQDDDSIICDSLFVIDTQPKLQDDLDVPTYGKKYEDTFEKTNSAKMTQLKDPFPKLSCFNCMGNHNLRDCQLPRNQANINKNRKEFTSKSFRLGVRYHMNEEQKFSHMIPGQLSQDLRTALGLKDNELPKHIYRMRMLGYPPGWLEEARLQHSGLSLFNSDGIKEIDPNAEEGEISTEVNKDLYDIKKIYDFPGFNVPPPPGTLDEYYRLCAPSMQPMHSKQAMLLFLQGKEADDGYKRKKLRLSMPSTNERNSEMISNEMEIDDGEESVAENVPVDEIFVSPLPKESAIKPPPLPPLSSSPLPSKLNHMIEDSGLESEELLSSNVADDTTAPSSRTNSPSLSDLESIKKQLLVELQDSSSQSNPDVSLKNNLNTTDTPDLQFSDITTTPESNRFSIPRKSLNTSGSVKSVDLGTPILESTSPYNRLPSSENFSKDICDIINYENLPDSTGKYEQMTGVLQKVRHTLAKLYDEP